MNQVAYEMSLDAFITQASSEAPQQPSQWHNELSIWAVISMPLQALQIFLDLPNSPRKRGISHLILSLFKTLHRIISRVSCKVFVSLVCC